MFATTASASFRFTNFMITLEELILSANTEIKLSRHLSLISLGMLFQDILKGSVDLLSEFFFSYL